jgi:hypothetical protein
VVRVIVDAEGAPRSPDDDAVDSGAIVRVYSEGRRTGARDPRTGVTVGNLAAVLQHGRLDEFILASESLATDAEKSSNEERTPNRSL